MTTTLDTNEMIGRLTGVIANIKQHETSLLTFVDDHGPKLETADIETLHNMIERGIEISDENAKHWKIVSEAKADGQLLFLDEISFRISLLRLKAAILTAKTACGDLVDLPF